VNATDPDPSAEEWLHRLCAAHGLRAGSHRGRTDYRLDGKIVANLEDDGAVTIKLPLQEQRAILDEHPALVRLPGGWAKHGWTTIRLDALGIDQAHELLAHSIAAVSGRPPSPS
jgi:hypothetical protein